MNLSKEIIEHERIKTTEAKAKAVKPEVEKLITLAKRGDLHARRQALSTLCAGQVRGAQAVRGPRAPLRRPPRWLHAHPQARSAPQRRDRDGLHRAGLTRRRLRRGAAAGDGHQADARVRRHRLRRLGAPARAGAPCRRRSSGRCARFSASTASDGGPLTLTVAGRTDRGVHAWGQVASYAHEAVDPLRLNGAARPTTSRCSPPSRRPDGFDARRDAISRTYCYRVLARRARSVFERATRALVAAPARPRGAGRVRERAPRQARLHRVHAHRDRAHALRARGAARAEWRAATATLLEFWIEADTFMRHMNRVLVGTMLEVASGRRTLERVRGRCSSGRPRAQAGPTAPAHGLALASVAYPPGVQPRRIGRVSILRKRRLTRRPPVSRAGPYAGAEPMLNVLLTNDDGIEAEGLQAMRGALVGARWRTPRGDRARRQPLGDGALDHHAPAAVGRRGAVRGRHRRLRHRRHAGGLRAAREPRAGRGLRRRSGRRRASTTARTSAMTSPTRARSRRRSRASCWACPRSPSPSSRARARSTTASTAASASRSRRRSSRGWWSGSRTCRCRRRTLLNVNVPAGEPGGVEVTSLGKRIYRDELKLEREEEHRRRYWIYGSDPGFHDEPGTDLAAVAAGRIAVTPIHFDLTDRAGLRGARRLRPGGAARAADRRSASATRRRERPRQGASPQDARASAGAARAARAPRAPLLRARRPGDRRRRVRRAAGRAARDRGATHPELRTPDSPTQRVGGEPVGRLEKVEHLEPMLSLGNVRSEEELRAWVERMRNHLAREGIAEPRFQYVVEPKIDGLAISLVYRDGVLRARRHARQRRDRRGRHAQPAHDRRDPAARARTRRRCWRCAARSTCRWRTSPR